MNNCEICEGKCNRKFCTWRSDPLQDALAHLGETTEPAVTDWRWDVLLVAAGALLGALVAIIKQVL